MWHNSFWCKFSSNLCVKLIVCVKWYWHAKSVQCRVSQVRVISTKCRRPYCATCFILSSALCRNVMIYQHFRLVNVLQWKYCINARDVCRKCSGTKCITIVGIFLVTFARIHDLTKHLRSENVSRWNLMLWCSGIAPRVLFRKSTGMHVIFGSRKSFGLSRNVMN